MGRINEIKKQIEEELEKELYRVVYCLRLKFVTPLEVIEEVAKIMDIPVSDITKGEPIFRDLIRETKYKHLLEEEDYCYSDK